MMEAARPAAARAAYIKQQRGTGVQGLWWVQWMLVTLKKSLELVHIWRVEDRV